MIEEIIQAVLEQIGHPWKFETGFAVPNVEDVKIVLDEAASILYDSDTDTRLETGGLIIEKRPKGYSVYVYVGDYE